MMLRLFSLSVVAATMLMIHAGAKTQATDLRRRLRRLESSGAKPAVLGGDKPCEEAQCFGRRLEESSGAKPAVLGGDKPCEGAQCFGRRLEESSGAKPAVLGGDKPCEG